MSTKSLFIALKDLRSALRSRVVIGVSVALPLLITGLIFLAFGGLRSGRKAPEIAVTKVGVVSLESPTAGKAYFGQALVELLRLPELAKLFSVSDFADEASARTALDQRRIGVAVIVPADFAQAISAPGRGAEVRLIQDPVLTVGPGILRGIIEQFLNGYSGSKIAGQLTAELVEQGSKPGPGQNGSALFPVPPGPIRRSRTPRRRPPWPTAGGRCSRARTYRA